MPANKPESHGPSELLTAIEADVQHIHSNSSDDTGRIGRIRNHIEDTLPGLNPTDRDAVTKVLDGLVEAAVTRLRRRTKARPENARRAGDVVIRYFGLNGKKPQTLEELSRSGDIFPTGTSGKPPSKVLVGQVKDRGLRAIRQEVNETENGKQQWEQVRRILRLP